MNSKKTVSVVLGTYNRFKFLKATVSSIRQELVDTSHEIIVVDGGSTDGTTEWLLEQKDIVTIVQHNRGQWLGKTIQRRSWGYFMNLGFKCSQGKYVCMLSDDCLLVPGAITSGVKLFEEKLAKKEKIGALAFYWRNWPKWEKYLVGLTLGNKMFVNHGLYLNCALKEVDYIDEETYFFYHADGDLCLKLWQKGYKCIDSPTSYVEHYTHANIKVRQSNITRQKQDWDNYLQKWSGIFYHGKETETGSSIQKEFNDKAKTVKQFPWTLNFPLYNLTKF